MSLIININELSQETREKIKKDLEIKLENKFVVGQARYIYPYSLEGNNLRLPFSYSVLLKIPRPVRENCQCISVDFIGNLREEQKLVRKESLQYLSKTGSILISCYCGFGKTFLAINLAVSTKLKTLIIVNKIVLIKQWKDSILEFCPRAKVQVLTPICKNKNQDADFYIINAQNTEKMGKLFFNNVKTVIVDECHMIMAETLSNCMNYICPRYLIGLSATPYRPDGLDSLIDFYFGKNKIVRKLYKKHTVYKVSTGFKPPVEKTIQGRINWGSILDAQANNKNRNDLIIKIIQYFKDRNFLVLVKRVEQGKYLSERLKELGEYVTDLIGSNQEFNKEARILVGTCQKVGTGFDHCKLDTLLLATDLEEYFVQYLGRIFRNKDNDPIVFDLVDTNGILNKHFNTRKSVYQEHGGIVKEFDMDLLKE
jgi:superfamily II DNA or RNA helicase